LGVLEVEECAKIGGQRVFIYTQTRDREWVAQRTQGMCADTHEDEMRVEILVHLTAMLLDRKTLQMPCMKAQRTRHRARVTHRTTHSLPAGFILSELCNTIAGMLQHEHPTLTAELL
jgi:hypothetical protein